MAKISPTQRALKRVREMGYEAQVVEKWNPFARKRIDLFQCVDVVAIRPGVPVLGIQACVHGDMTKRVRKCIEFGQGWLSTGHTQLEVWAFRRLKGKRALQLDRRVIPLVSQQEAR